MRCSSDSGLFKYVVFLYPIDNDVLYYAIPCYKGVIGAVDFCCLESSPVLIINYIEFEMTLVKTHS
jgi:hypothetical protein